MRIMIISANTGHGAKEHIHIYKQSLESGTIISPFYEDTEA